MGSPGANAYTQVRVREPGGERICAECLTIGGAGADIVVPGTPAEALVRIERQHGIWVMSVLAGARLRSNGRAVSGTRDLRRQDVVSIGDAQVIVLDSSRTLLRLDVCHLAGNATVPPTSLALLDDQDQADEELRISLPRAHETGAPETLSGAHQRRGFFGRHAVLRNAAIWRSRHWRIYGPAIALVLLALFLCVTRLNSVSLDVEPRDAMITAPGTHLKLHLGDRLLLWPGEHWVRATRKGYVSSQTKVFLGPDAPANVRLRLTKLPGILRIDTAGVPSSVSIDGVEAGQVPGPLSVPAGRHTLTLRAPHYVDHIATVDVIGTGTIQQLQAILQPAWGSLLVAVIPVGAQVTVDDSDKGVAPVNIAMPAGIHHVRISAPHLKTWESSIVLQAGETLSLGPISLGQPDAHLALRSDPSGAEVAIDGVLYGRTPLQADLAAGIQHELMINLPGRKPWRQQVFAESGKQLTIQARLEAEQARITIEGEPADALVLVDGIERGPAPQSLQLASIVHHLEVRKPGWVTLIQSVTAVPGFDRVIHYRLTQQGSDQLASLIYTQTGYMLRLVPTTSTVAQASESGPAASGARDSSNVVLKRPFYLGVAPVSNEQFRRFRAGHDSGASPRHPHELDDQPVTHVGWTEAVEYCNWLSEQDSLPAAYELREGHYLLRRPVTIGYRLPTQAEWEFVARTPGSSAPHDLGSHMSEWVSDYYSKVAWRAAADDSASKVGFRLARYAE